jgi:hypothetical protein
MEIRWAYPEHPDEDLAAHVLEVRKVSRVVPMSAQQLLDAGILLPPGVEPPPAPKPLPWRIRWRMARAEFIDTWRRRVGFWIAGYEPRDDWDW